jgi:hypothetical protein
VSLKHTSSSSGANETKLAIVTYMKGNQGKCSKSKKRTGAKKGMDFRFNLMQYLHSEDDIQHVVTTVRSLRSETVRHFNICLAQTCPSTFWPFTNLEFQINFQLWCLQGLLPNAYLWKGSFPWVMRPGSEAYHSPPTSAEVKRTWVYTSTPPPSIRFHGVVL